MPCSGIDSRPERGVLPSNAAAGRDQPAVQNTRVAWDARVTVPLILDLTAQCVWIPGAEFVGTQQHDGLRQRPSRS